jgi:hypothetical protein
MNVLKRVLTTNALKTLLLLTGQNKNVHNSRLPATKGAAFSLNATMKNDVNKLIIYIPINKAIFAHISALDIQ